MALTTTGWKTFMNCMVSCTILICAFIFSHPLHSSFPFLHNPVQRSTTPELLKSSSFFVSGYCGQSYADHLPHCVVFSIHGFVLGVQGIDTCQGWLLLSKLSSIGSFRTLTYLFETVEKKGSNSKRHLRPYSIHYDTGIFPSLKALILSYKMDQPSLPSLRCPHWCMKSNSRR